MTSIDSIAQEAGQLSPDTALKEFKRIARWWLENAVDTDNGGFAGEIDYRGSVVAGANKGSVLNCRILWFFSEAAALLDDADCQGAARRAFDYLQTHFHDDGHGGVFWELDCRGTVVDDRKKIYAQSFAIYALVAYYSMSAERRALDLAGQLFDCIERHARDRQYGGYIEALSRHWQPIDDVRLSDRDLNAPKSMNTHLHLLEAYTALYNAQPGDVVENALRQLIDIFCSEIVDVESGHLRLFFDEQWTALAFPVSYGHDIEASWLLCEAAIALRDDALLHEIHRIALRLASTCIDQGVARDKHVLSEAAAMTTPVSQPSTWWVQAEALVGFLNAYQLCGDARFRVACYNSWEFIYRHHLDTEYGDWHALASSDARPASRHYKAGFWKGPYHNGRAMLECYRRLSQLQGERRHA